MSNFKGNSLKFLREMAIIFIGVVLALIGENYIENINERKTERNYLVDLLDELETSMDVYRDDRVRYHQVDSAALELINMSVTGDTSEYKPCHLIQYVVQLIEPDIYSSVYEDLKSSGNMGVIRNRDLRIVIIQYYQRQAYEERWARDIHARISGTGEQRIGDLLTVEEFNSESTCNARRVLHLLKNRDIVESLNRVRKVAITNGLSLQGRIEHNEWLISLIKEELSKFD